MEVLCKADIWLMVIGYMEAVTLSLQIRFACKLYGNLRDYYLFIIFFFIIMVEVKS